jgi:hypothetical protein
MPRYKILKSMPIKNKSAYNGCESAGDPMVGFILIQKETNIKIQKPIHFLDG